jgi:hypothetical protein
MGFRVWVGKLRSSRAKVRVHLGWGTMGGMKGTKSHWSWNLSLKIFRCQVPLLYHVTDMKLRLARDETSSHSACLIGIFYL